MDRLEPALVLLAVGVLAWVGLAIAARRRLRSWRARARARRAVRGERRAEALLEARGYAIEARQRAGRLVLQVDGAPHESALRCDLVVTRGGRRFVAEVKTGSVAPRLDHAATRRQIVEYLVAFDAEGVLLVDAERGEVREIALRRERPSPLARPSWTTLVAIASLASLATWLTATWLASR